MSVQSLNNALSGLRVAQQQLSVISNNISNVNTDGYTRKILPQSSLVAEGTGQQLGVRSEIIIRQVDFNLTRDLWTQQSATSALEVRSSYLSKVEAFHGPPDAEISIAAELAALQDEFAVLADDPSSGSLQSAVLAQAQTVANRFNDFGDLITNLRNDTQDQIELKINEVNGLLQQVADLNDRIRTAIYTNKSTADLEDLRDEAVKQISQNLDISTYVRGDGVMEIQTRDGVLLTNENPTSLYFSPTVLGASSAYPDSAAGIYSDGNPAQNQFSIDITQGRLGGSIGALIELRDETLVQYQAQIDELAHKTALRFEAQGLRLYTNALGQVPADTAPDIGTVPPTPVSYVGFASLMQVNQLIIDDNSLLQSGTYSSDVTILPGSSEVLDRVLEYTFGSIDYQRAVGTTNLVTGAFDLQQHLGIFSQNLITLGPDLTEFTELDSAGASSTDIATLIGDLAPTYPADDEFRIQLYDRTGAPTAVTIDVDLSTIGADPLYAIGAVDPSGTLADGTIDNALDQLVAYINTTIIAEEGALNIPTDIQARASINAYGQLILSSRGDVEFVSTGFANAMGDAIFSGIFGSDARLYETSDPYFDVQVGTGDPVRITIAPGEDETDLLNKLEKLTAIDPGVAGLLVDDVAFAAGTLSLRPGMDDTAFGGPQFGGALKLVAGLGTADGTGGSGVAAGSNILEALFGNASPVSNVGYGSETSQNMGVGSGVFVPLRSQYLGQNASISTGMVSNGTLIDFSQKMIAKQSQDLTITQNSQSDEETLRDILDTRLKNESGVNLDEELSNLILIQTAYSAAARAITAVNEIFDELLAAVR